MKRTTIICHDACLAVTTPPSFYFHSFIPLIQNITKQLVLGLLLSVCLSQNIYLRLTAAVEQEERDWGMIINLRLDVDIIQERFVVV